VSEPRLRVLSLDGGGSRAGILAKALGAIYTPATKGREILRDFDLVAGNSGGSIVIAALACGYTPGEIAGFYDSVDTLERMFCPKWNADIPVLNWAPHYSTQRKFRALGEILDAKARPGQAPPSSIKLKDWPAVIGRRSPGQPPLEILIPAFDLDRKRATFFRSRASSRARSSDPGVDPTLLQAVHASTTAPILYFDEPACFQGRQYWDGGLGGYDNPVLAAVVEMLANRPAARDALRVLSIGTSMQLRPPANALVPPPLGEPSPGGSWLREVKLAASVIFDDPPDAATFHAHVALGQPLPAPEDLAPVAGNIVRLSPFVRPDWTGSHWEVPCGFTDDEFQALFGMRLDVRDAEGVALIGKMTSLWLAGKLANQPIRMGEHFRCDIGDAAFPAAVARWRVISA
jgi:uncharacterized protein